MIFTKIDLTNRDKWRKEILWTIDKWTWWMDLWLRMTLTIDKSNIKIGRNISMIKEILMTNTILTLDTIILLIDRGMLNKTIKDESTITHHPKDLITRSNKMMVLLTNLNSMSWIKLWIYMARMIIIITSTNNNLPIKITLITMTN